MDSGFASESESPPALAPRALYFWMLVSSVALLASPLQQPTVWCGVLLLLSGIVLARRWRPVEAMAWLVLRVATAAWALPLLTSAQVLAAAVDIIWLCYLVDSSRRSRVDGRAPSSAAGSSATSDDSGPGPSQSKATGGSELPWEGLPVRTAVAAAVFFGGLARINWSYLAEVSAEAHVAGTAASLGLSEGLLWKSAAVCLPLFISVGMLRARSCQFALTTAVLFWLAEIWKGSPDQQSLAGVCLSTVPVFLQLTPWLSLDAWRQPWLAQLVERHVGQGAAVGGLVVSTHPLVRWHGLLPPGSSVTLWLTVFAVLALMLVIVGRPVSSAALWPSDRGRGWSTWLPSHWLAGALATVCVMLVLANGLAPYFGLKTFGTFSDGARLRTEGLRPNHLFMPQMYLLPHQLELAEIVQLSPADPEIAPHSDPPASTVKPGEIVPVFELERLAADRPELTVSFRLCGQLPDVYQLGQASGWRGERAWWQRKLLAYHPVARDPAR